ncbi:hypothetical protein [Peribacillus aracenensis]|nr:hypothetical protein [Peribacillus sp. BBB004]
MVFTLILIGWKKYATLLPNNWLAETLQLLALMRSQRKERGLLKTAGTDF